MKTLLHTYALLILTVALLVYILTIQYDALQNTKTCLEITKLSRDLSQEVINQTVIEICDDLIRKE